MIAFCSLVDIRLCLVGDEFFLAGFLDFDLFFDLPFDERTCCVSTGSTM
jgi:hypothetical protein